VRRQIARPHQVGDSGGERLLQPLRRALGRVRQLGRDRRLGQEGEVDLLNPLFRMLLLIGVNPYGLAILETRGRVSGKIRRVPVGNGRKGDEFWIIAEHGRRAGWVHNIRHDPRVRIRLRVGLRYHWLDGIASVRPDEDPLARQRRIIAWHPLRALNAINVRVFGADLLVVHVQLQVAGAGRDPARTGQKDAPNNRENRVINEPEKV